jgi:hypothetical protein
MLDRLGPDRGISDGTGTWSFVTPRVGSEYELPSIDHLPEPEPQGRHARRRGRHSAGSPEAQAEAAAEAASDAASDAEDLASERRLYLDLPGEPQQGWRGGEANSWEAEHHPWGQGQGQGQGWGNGR